MSAATVRASAPVVQDDRSYWFARAVDLAKRVLKGHPTHFTEEATCPCGEQVEKTECRFFPAAINVLKFVRSQRPRPVRAVTVHVSGAYGGYARSRDTAKEGPLPDIRFDVLQARRRLVNEMAEAEVLPDRVAIAA